MTISIKATRAQASSDATSISGPTTVLQGTSNTYTITDFDSFAVYSIAATTGTVSRTGQTVTLVIAAGEPATTMQLTITRDSSSVVKNIAIGAQTIGTPAITSPASGSTDVNLPVTLLATDFTPYPSGADTHASSDWRVKNAGGTVIWQSLADTVNKTSVTIPTASLSPATQYFADVRYNGNTLGSSQYSAANQFTTSAISIVRPSITSPVNGATGIGQTPTFTSSTFATIPAGSDSHASSNWRVKNASTGTVVWSSLNDSINKTSVTMPTGILLVSTAYTVEVQYNGSTLPTSAWSVASGFTTATAFDFGEYLAYGQWITPFMGVYGQDVDTLVKLPNPATTPPNIGRAAAFSPDGAYLAYAHDDTPYVTIYKRSGDSFVKLANPSALPPGRGVSVSFSPDNVYLAVGCNASPYVIIYKRSGDVFTKLANPASLPLAPSVGCAFSPDGVYFGVSTTATPFIHLYKRSGDIFTAISAPAAGFATAGYGCAFSPDGNYFGVASASSPYINLYKRAGDVFTKLASPSSLPPSGCFGIAFSPDSTHITVAANSSPFILIYKRSGDVLTKLSDPTTLPSSTARAVAYSGDSNYLAIATDSSPFVHLYKRSGDTYTKLANPATLPTGQCVGIALNPPVLGR